MNPSDLILVFDEYLKKSGAGKNYIANKILELFDSQDSPFNKDGKLIENLKDGIKDFNKKIKKFKLPNFYTFNRAMDGALKKVRDFKDNFKVSSFYTFNREMDGALKKVRDFKDNFKVSRDKFQLPRDKFQLPDFDTLKNSILNASTVVDDFSNNFQSPSFDNFKKAMDGALKKIRDFKDNFKVSSFYTFNRAMEGALHEVRTFRDNLKVLNKSLGGGLGGLGIEPALGTNNVVDVNLVAISDKAAGILSKIFRNLKIQNTNLNINQDKSKDEGSFIGKLIKGIIGTFAFVAGVGFLSTFLDTPIGKNIKAITGDLTNRFIEMIIPFLKKLIDYSIEGLKVLFWELPKHFLKQTFNFFGLKEILGKENDGIAVLLTKGIYYGVKMFFNKSLNFFSFGLFDKLKGLFNPLFSIEGKIGGLEKLGRGVSYYGDKLINTITKPFSVLKNSLRIVSSSATNISGKIGGYLSVFKNIPSAIGSFFKKMGFGSGGGIGKVLGSFSKLGGGTILKLLGTGLKAIAKRAPIIGGLISFKDAYDRLTKGDVIGGLISIGSGIAGFMPPGVGTAIMIGLDVLNAFLDKKVEGGATSKLSAIGDLFGSIGEAIWNTLKEIGNIILSPFTLLLKKLKGWFFGETKDKLEVPENKNVSPLKTENKKPVLEENKNKSSWIPQKVNDAKISNNKLIIPSTADDVVMAKNGGPFDSAFKEMNSKLNELLIVFAQGSQLIANSTIQGSSNVVQAVVSTGGNQTPIVIGNNDPIAEFRERANKTLR